MTGILAEEAARLNEKFCHWHQAKASVRAFENGDFAGRADFDANGRFDAAFGQRIGERKSHELRHEYDAILVGANTATVDNPSLTDRSGKSVAARSCASFWIIVCKCRSRRIWF